MPAQPESAPWELECAPWGAKSHDHMNLLNFKLNLLFSTDTQQQQHSKCFFFLSCFINPNFCFIVGIGSNLRNMRQEEGGKAATTKTGPNDASGVVWAISKSIFFSCFIITNYYI
jgi:hypothetical protein